MVQTQKPTRYNNDVCTKSVPEMETPAIQCVSTKYPT